MLVFRAGIHKMLVRIEKKRKTLIRLLHQSDLGLPCLSKAFLATTSVRNKMLVFRARIHKRLVKIANREDPDQTALSVAV